MICCVLLSGYVMYVQVTSRKYLHFFKLFTGSQIWKEGNKVRLSWKTMNQNLNVLCTVDFYRWQYGHRGYAWMSSKDLSLWDIDTAFPPRDFHRCPICCIHCWDCTLVRKPLNSARKKDSKVNKLRFVLGHFPHFCEALCVPCIIWNLFFQGVWVW